MFFDRRDFSVLPSNVCTSALNVSPLGASSRDCVAWQHGGAVAWACFSTSDALTGFVQQAGLKGSERGDEVSKGRRLITVLTVETDVAGSSNEVEVGATGEWGEGERRRQANNNNTTTTTTAATTTTATTATTAAATTTATTNNNDNDNDNNDNNDDNDDNDDNDNNDDNDENDDHNKLPIRNLVMRGHGGGVEIRAP